MVETKKIITDTDGNSNKAFLYTFNPLTWNLYFRPLASLTAGIAIATMSWIVTAIFCYFLGLSSPFSLLLWFGIAALSAGYVYFVENNEPEKVSETKYLAIVTWLGMVLPIFRKTGEYGWQGSVLGFGRTRKITPEFTDNHGFIKAGEIPFKVWNDPDSAKKNHIISAPAKNRAHLEATLTLILESVNPRLILDSDDPELDIGDRSRQEFRELVNNFVDTDVPSLGEAVEDVLRGYELITAFLPSSTGGYKAGSMIRDTGGNVMFTIIKPKENKKLKYSKLSERILKDALPAMKKLVTKKGEGDEVEVSLNEVKIKRPVTEVIEALGFVLKRATMGDIVLSEPVTNAANQASAESDERASQIASAETNRAAREKMLPSKKELDNPGWETAMILAAAQDDKNGAIKVVLVPGGNKFTQAAVAGGLQIGGGK